MTSNLRMEVPTNDAGPAEDRNDPPVNLSSLLRKEIRSSRDLAVNGATPAFVVPLHVGRPNLGNRKEFLRYAGEIYDRRWLTNNGPLVQELERRLAEYLGVRNCVVMCNGTVALEIAIRALNLEGEVIIPSFTFIATAHALHWQAITPVFADIDPKTHNLDPDAVRRMITPKTTGIIGVHLWGRAAPVEALQSVATEFGLELLFDAAHAFGCSHNGQMIGGFGRAEIFSFHATKSFNSLEGGAVATNDDELAEAMRLMRNFGFAGYDNVIHPGTNGKMVEICAAMGLVNLESFESTVEINHRNHSAYREALSGIPGISVLDYDDSEHNNYHYIIVEVGPEFPVPRDRVIEILHAENILARRYFWPGCHRMKPYRDLFPNAGLLLRNSESVADRVLLLPNGSDLPEETQAIVGDIFRVLSDYRE